MFCLAFRRKHPQNAGAVLKEILGPVYKSELFQQPSFQDRDSLNTGFMVAPNFMLPYFKKDLNGVNHH